MLRKRITVFCFFLLTVLVLAFIFLHLDRGHKMNENATVRVVKNDGGYQLLRYGKPFYVKGASGDGYIKELAEAGGNTIRLYDTIDASRKLDEAYKNGIAVILDIPLPDYREGNAYYSNEQRVNELTTYILSYVNKHKNHPALLYWNLGNELIYPLTLFPNQFTKTINGFIQAIHDNDPNHPVSTTIAGTSRAQTIGIHLHSPKFDLVGYNVFGSARTLKNLQKTMSYFFRLKPYLISEWGIEGPWEVDNLTWYSLKELNGNEKADGYLKIYHSYIGNNSSMLGSTAFYWGNKFEGSPDWFNVFDERGRRSSIYYALKECWTHEKNVVDLPIDLNSVQFENDEEFENLIFSVNEEKQASIDAVSLFSDSLQYDWHLYKEGTGVYEIWQQLNDSLIVKNNKSSIIFKTPNTEGAYRMLLKVYDQHNNFTTANFPFYVLNPNAPRE